MWDKFGEFDSAEEINRAAAAQFAEGDVESLKLLACENGIDEADVEDYVDGQVDELTTPVLAAIGKLDMEIVELHITGVLLDWTEELKALCTREEAIARAVRKKGKDLAGYIALIAETGYKNRAVVDRKIVEKTTEVKKIVGNHEFSIGIPTRAERKEIIKSYYMGEGDKT